ncbi:uncharacterized PPE family protein PPE62-like [Mytilus trossulus]|uniref:uncharacterized PPE family protein PPE62-like n=1 Tax=Mytilus trossulus TaxID=6551 RepID=UPI0030051A7C
MKLLALLVCVLLYARSGDAQAKKATPKPVAAGAVGKMDRNCFDMHQTGMCMGMFVQRWFFSETSGRCFLNQGCFYQGFATIRECNKECRCKQPMNEGAGSGGFNCELEVQKYAFAGEACTPFMYTGCGGNGNRFNSITQCMNTCKAKEFEHTEMLGEFGMMGHALNQMGWNMGNNGGGFRNGMNRNSMISRGMGNTGMGMGSFNMGMGNPGNGMRNPGNGMGHSNMGMGNPGNGMGHSNMGMGHSNMGMGNPSNGMGHSNMGMGNPSNGMGNPSNGMGNPSNSMGNPSNGMGNPSNGIGNPSNGMGNSNMGMGSPNTGMGNTGMDMRNPNTGMSGLGNGQMGMGNTGVNGIVGNNGQMEMGNNGGHGRGIGNNGGNGMGNMGTTISNTNNKNVGMANTNSAIGSGNPGVGSQNAGTDIAHPNQAASLITGSTSGSAADTKANTGIASFSFSTAGSKNVRNHILDKSAMPNQGNGQMPGLTNPGTGWTNTGMRNMQNTNNPGMGNTGMNNNPSGSMGTGGGGMNMAQNMPPPQNHNFGQGNSFFGSQGTNSQSSFGNNNAMNPTTTIVPGTTNMATWMFMGVK